jgi:hypothetical protein
VRETSSLGGGRGRDRSGAAATVTAKTVAVTVTRRVSTNSPQAEVTRICALNQVWAVHSEHQSPGGRGETGPEIIEDVSHKCKSCSLSGNVLLINLHETYIQYL